MFFHGNEANELKGRCHSSGTPLHYAALWGLHSIVEFLIIEHSQDVHSRGFTDNATPLHLASKNGHVKVARMLIEHGADVTAQNKDGETPLHLASQEGTSGSRSHAYRARHHTRLAHSSDRPTQLPQFLASFSIFPTLFHPKRRRIRRAHVSPPPSGVDRPPLPLRPLPLLAHPLF
jgi:hypothetical protein